jgi:hypothetical protein
VVPTKRGSYSKTRVVKRAAEKLRLTYYPLKRLTNALHGPHRGHRPVRETRQHPDHPRFVPAFVIRPVKHSVSVLAIACVLLAGVAAGAAPAAVAAAPCWKKLLNDWYDGRIDNLYAIPCYRSAIDHLPTDVREYSSARDDIDRALQAAIKHEQQPKAPVPAATTPSPAATPAKTTTAKTTTPTTTTAKKTTTTKRTITKPGRKPKQGPIPSAIDSSSPGGATSFPLPLLILGGLALFLLAAGVVGLIVRRMQGRGGDGPSTT